MTNHKISVSEALQKLESGESVSNYSIDFNRIKVEALDVMKLSKGGIVVPEAVIYYDDNNNAYDEDFEGDWVKVNAPAKAKQTEVKIVLKDDISQWVESNNVQLDHLIEKLLDGFYRAQKMVHEKS
ncbi:MAG: hypothetical protein Q7T20_08965 [Saprospiraceae bacterium]|nr:hypothetical protein [Saprospiraceae bacterium]